MNVPSFSLRAQVAFLLAIATLPVGVLGLAQSYATYNEVRSLRLNTLAIDAAMASDRERRAIRETFGALDALSAQIGTVPPIEPCATIMRAYVESDGQVSFAGVRSADGAMLCGYPLDTPLDLRETQEYQHFIDNPRRMVTVHKKGGITGEPVIVAHKPIVRDEIFAGSIVVATPSKYLDWANSENQERDGHFAIVSSQDLSEEGQRNDPEDDWLPSPKELKTLLKDARNTGVLSSAIGGGRIYSVTPLFENDIFSVSSWPISRAETRITPTQILILLLPLVMWGLAVFVAYFAVDRFALRHVVYLDRLVAAYTQSKGGLRASGVRDAPLEFAKLGASFDLMAQDIEKREHDLQRSVAEKDSLLKEVYHRVKNNLQLVCSLVNLQLRDARNDHEREGLQRLQDRVHGLAAVHQRLSEAERFNAVRIDELLKEITEQAKEVRGDLGSHVSISLDLMPYSEGPDRAIPIVLLASEAIANAFKHALEKATLGWLRVSLSESDDDLLLLEIVNSLPEGIPQPSADPTGLGSQLIQGFTSQLRGTLERNICSEYYILKIRFPRSEE